MAMDFLSSPIDCAACLSRPRQLCLPQAQDRHRSRPCAREHPLPDSLAQTPAVGLAPAPTTMTMSMRAAGLSMFRGSHLAALPCLQRLGGAAAFARGLATDATYGRLGFYLWGCVWSIGNPVVAEAHLCSAYEVEFAFCFGILLLR